MGLNLPDKVWVYAERLYISSYSANEFVQLLKGFGINYDNPLYEQFNFAHTKPFYTFMSNEDYAFAEFIRAVPTYKYLSVLEPIVFDEKVIATKNDNWNYYGEYIKNWYPTLIELLELAVLPMTDHFAPVQRPEWIVSMVSEFLEAPMPEKK